jgi:alginate O-acetyltransferase complex protein AlgI
MVFSSPIFLFMFLPIILAAYSACKGNLRWQNPLLLLGSLFFYTWGEGFYLLIMLGSIVINYATGLWITHANTPKAKWWALAVGVALNLLILGTYKYTNFIVDSANVLLLGAGMDALIVPPVHLPIGISFFTFQAISYIVDVYRGHAPVQRNIMHVALYISLFPQLIAGPIVRYNTIATELTSRKVTKDDFAEGVRRFIIGLGKKVLIADNLAILVDQTYGTPAELLTPAAAWFGMACFTLQIYFDFSGYSDMAIGIGRMLGFHFKENFIYPYTAKSISEAWKGWHISMTTWFRDYLYLPLCGRRPSKLRSFSMMVVVFFLCGLWHGANWTFVCWGMFHGIILVAERLSRHTSLEKLCIKLPRIIKHAYVVVMISLTMALFRSPDVAYALSYYSTLFGGNEGTANIAISGLIIACFVCGIIGSTPLSQKIYAWGYATKPQATEVIHFACLIIILMLAVINASAYSYQPFIYFRF